MLFESLEGVIGVDTHRDTLAAAAITAVGATLGHADAPASAEGYQQLLDFARAQVPGGRCWAVEGTSSYGTAVAVAATLFDRLAALPAGAVLNLNVPDRAEVGPPKRAGLAEFGRSAAASKRR